MFHYTPETGELKHMGDANSAYHMVIAFGTPETWMELANLIRDPEWESMLADFGEFSILGDSEQLERTMGTIGHKQWHWPMFYARLVAFSAWLNQDQTLAKKAWEMLLFSADNSISLPIQSALSATSEGLQTVK